MQSDTSKKVRTRILRLFGAAEDNMATIRVSDIMLQRREEEHKRCGGCGSAQLRPLS